MTVSNLNISKQSFLEIFYDRKIHESPSSVIFKGKETISDKEVWIEFLKTESEIKNVIRESVKKLTWLSHPNLLEYISTFQVDKPGFLDFSGASEACDIIVLEPFEGAAGLEIYLRTRPTNDIKKRIVIDVLDGLSYLHSNQIIHGNLNLRNVFLKQEKDSIQVKLSGFGLVENVDDFMQTEFRPPEYFKDTVLSPASDIWSFGVLVYYIAMGKYPFGNCLYDNEDDVKSNIVSGNILEHKAELSPKISYVIHKCLQVDPMDRFSTVQEIQNVLTGDSEIPQSYLDKHFAPDDELEEEEKVDADEVTPSASPNSEALEEDEIMRMINYTPSEEEKKRNENWRVKSQAKEQDTALGWTWSVLWIIIGLLIISIFSISIINKKTGDSALPPTQNISEEPPQPADKKVLDPDADTEKTESELPKENIGNVEAKGPPVDPQNDERVPAKTDNRRIVFDGNNALQGLKDGAGNVIVPPKYSMIGEFDQNNLAMVRHDGKWGFIDKEGRETIPPSFEFVTEFKGGFAAVRNNGKWGFINTNGESNGSIIYDYVMSYSDGLAAVSNNDKWGFINSNQDLVIPYQYDQVKSFSGGRSTVILDSKEMVINKSGECVEGC